MPDKNTLNGYSHDQTMGHLANRYLTEKEVSELTGLALSTLRNHRFLCKGLPYIKIGKSIRYSLQDVIQYMESHRIEPLN
jgi:predicted DNA-binding transcriptional regulator AlpA